MKTIFKRSLFAAVAIFSAGAIVNTLGCGSSSSTTTSAVTITGTVSAPTTAASVSVAGLAIKSASGVAAGASASDTVKICSFKGEEIGTATTDDSGAYTVADLARTVIDPSGLGSLKFKGILLSEKGYCNFAELSVDAATTSYTLDADINGAMACSSLLIKAGKDPAFDCSIWNFEDADLDFDPFCHYAVEQHKYRDGVAGGGNLGASSGASRDVAAAALGSGRLDEFGGDPYAMFKGLHDPNSTVPPAFISDMQSRAGDFSGRPSTDYANFLDDRENDHKMRDFAAANYAGGEALGTSALNLQGVATPEEDSLCDRCHNDPDACEQMAKLMNGYKSFGSLDEALGAEGCGALLNDVFDQYKVEEGGKDFDFGGDKGKFDPNALAGQFEGLKGGCAGHTGAQIHQTLGAMPDDISKCGADINEVMRAVGETCKDNPDDCDKANVIGFWCGQDGIPPAGAGAATAYNDACPVGVDCSACLDPDDPACDNLQEGAGFKQGYCGDGICQANLGEDNTFCSIDCASDGGNTGTTTAKDDRKGAGPSQAESGGACLEHHHCVPPLNCVGATPPSTPGTCG